MIKHELIIYNELSDNYSLNNDFKIIKKDKKDIDITASNILKEEET